MPHTPEGPGEFVKVDKLGRGQGFDRIYTAPDGAMGGQTLWVFDDNGFDQVMVITGRIGGEDVYLCLQNPGNQFAPDQWDKWSVMYSLPELADALEACRHFRRAQVATGAVGTVDEDGISHPPGSKHEEHM